MKITHKMMKEDVSRISDYIKLQDVSIPSFWACIKVGFVFLLTLILWQTFVTSGDVRSTYGSPVSDASILWAGIIGVMVLLQSFIMRSRYLSLPKVVREQSMIIRFISRKVFIYCGIYILISFMSGMATKIIILDPWVSAGTMTASFILLQIFFLMDFGRYDLSLFNAVISKWREQSR